MRTKSIVLLLLALGCGLIASIGISQVIQNNRLPDVPVLETEEVVVAVKEIKIGDKIKPDQIKLEPRTKLTIPKGAYKSIDEIVKANLPLRSNVYPGEVLLADRFKSEDRMVARKIPSGFRVFTIMADNVSGVGLIEAENRVDVTFYYSSTGPNQESVAKTILYNVKVFAVNGVWNNGNETDETNSAVKNVSLLVTPEQATILGFAQERGKLKLSLRPENEETVSGQDFDIAKLQDILRGTGNRSNDEQTEQKNMATNTLSKLSDVGSSFLSALRDSAKEAHGNDNPSAPAPALPFDTFRMTILEGSQERAVEFSKAKEPNAKWQNNQTGTGFGAGAQRSLPTAPASLNSPVTTHTPAAPATNGADKTLDLSTLSL
ncbi:MAG: Flp pilus assembly protein CpaB [Pirellulales bacterium]|nr:Flp pilus assembly protein CpaB [Pirellulales bacterium]